MTHVMQEKSKARRGEVLVVQFIDGSWEGLTWQMTSE